MTVATAISASILLVLGLGLNASKGASQGSPASQAAQQAEQGVMPAENAKPVLADGTPVRLKFVRAAASSQVIAGEKLPLEVVEAVLVGKLVAIPQQSAQEAIVTMARAKRSMGRGGNLQLKIESVRLADGQLVPVRAVSDVKGEGRKALRIATYPIWPLDIKGKDATIPAGTEITAYITGDFPLDASKFQTSRPTSPQEKSTP